jgi:hypothetical protein
MELKNIFTSANPDILIFFLTSLFAFIAWMVKGLIEKPLTDSKITFSKYLEKRIEILSEVKVRLSFIAYFPTGNESKIFKEQLQQIMLKDGRIGYLDKSTFLSTLKISIDPITDEKLLLDTITQIDEDLFKQISKVQDEIKFYRRFSNFNPLKKFVGFTMLSILYIISFVLIISAVFGITYGLLFADLSWKVVIIILSILGFYFINLWMRQ